MNSTQAGRLIAFSGIDGAGKSTQIAALRDSLSSRGWKVAQIAFWEDAAVLPRFRAGVSLRALANSNECEEIPLRNDKNVRVWYLTLIRSVFYLLDALHLRTVVDRLMRSGADFIILDRWSYDQVVHIKSRNWMARAYIKTVLALAPSPNVAFVLDAIPEDAFRRKPEYPLAFLHEYRQDFLALKNFVPGLQIISPGPIDEVHRQILEGALHEPAQPCADGVDQSAESTSLSSSP
jgi:thymidylate kinase